MTHEVVSELITLGARGEDGVPRTLRDRDAAWRILQRDIDWDEAGRDLPEEQLRCLIRGLTHYSRARGSAALGGSVSPAISLFAAYAKRFPELEPALTGWIVAHRVNPYEPFGSLICNDAPTIEAHFLERLKRRAIAREHEQFEHERQKRAAERRADIATSRLVAAVTRGDVKAVEALFATGADAEKALPGESLVHLASVHGRTAVVELLQRRGIR